MDTLITENHSLEKIHQLALDNQIAFVSYCLPGQEELTTLIQWKSEPEKLSDITQLQSRSGFVFAPFDLHSKHPLRLIQPDLIIKGKEYTETLLHAERSYQPVVVPPDDRENKYFYATGREEYMQQVEEVRRIIAGSSLDKLVLSRISTEPKPRHFNPSLFLQKLKESYPDAFVFMLYIADAGLWFGASPEPLLQVKNQRASTVSLAGTRIYRPDNQFSHWGAKELEEQQMVTRYIDDTISGFGIEEIQKHGPESQKAGTVEHLLTRFSFGIQKLQDKIPAFLNALHPTPSVCGLPKEMALEVIKATEKHDREYYTGFLGPVNLYHEWNVFVNLRSMKVVKDQLAYFLGAGITAGSDPANEWEETNYKKNTLFRIMETLNKK